MAKQTQHRIIGDRRIAISGQLKRPNGSVVDLTGLTVSFVMYDSEEVAKVAETTDNVTVSDAANGKVYYAPEAEDVDTEGTFHAYFIVSGAGLKEHFPAQKGHFRIQIHNRT